MTQANASPAVQIALPPVSTSVVVNVFKNLPHMDAKPTQIANSALNGAKMTNACLAITAARFVISIVCTVLSIHAMDANPANATLVMFPALMMNSVKKAKCAIRASASLVVWTQQRSPVLPLVAENVLTGQPPVKQMRIVLRVSFASPLNRDFAMKPATAASLAAISKATAV